ncbi:uncharacterized protein LOC127867425 [Dreissena polymorpha]|uniref:uncharacterized protein LOC127867425 n=1 Tax=Dreissena polymorpha TaxID=45954 RepID=UPI002264B54D|nr:uncharacterized protein LOC127867425 [Dreissena polymorpha]XP_052264530.1 uncharacterized protein LOC127867425 [Dreissena polymorpha]XP_052264531.1 uncharacterized protein LOC127867425 [Dreissena polymorpha]
MGKLTNTNTWSVYSSGALLFALSGGFLVLVGFVMPYWVTFGHKPCIGNSSYGVTVYVSVWYGMVCDMDNPTYCRMKGIRPQTSNNFNFSQLAGCNAEYLSVRLASGLGGYELWTAVQIVTSVGLVLIFVASIMVEAWRCGGYRNRGFVAAISSLLILGGVAVLAMVILVIVGLDQFFDVPKIFEKVPGTFVWSVLTSGIGALLALAGGCLATVEVRKWEEFSEKYRQDDTKDGLMETAQGTSSGQTNKTFSIEESSSADQRGSRSSSSASDDMGGVRQRGQVDKGYDSGTRKNSEEYPYAVSMKQSKRQVKESSSGQTNKTYSIEESSSAVQRDSRPSSSGTDDNDSIRKRGQVNKGYDSGTRKNSEEYPYAVSKKPSKRQAEQRNDHIHTTEL